ncbi:hypothetical protein A6R68_15314 [Neotoma lepida]|uniref:Uncharacterized protein n=1 Tax=Neotoma lepida TaxID=56216 RepID=A0A1A6H8G2_NEOLE|nr:hypothetical protein A6R68_15314 [Neotoma lepida]
MSYNPITGIFQRLDKLKNHTFAIVILFGPNNGKQNKLDQQGSRDRIDDATGNDAPGAEDCAVCNTPGLDLYRH